jgi:hypothetical protein
MQLRSDSISSPLPSFRMTLEASLKMPIVENMLVAKDGSYKSGAETCVRRKTDCQVMFERRIVLQHYRILLAPTDMICRSMVN